ncbi:MAG: GspE/PulE family protein [Cytophagales bacterium]
MSPKEIIESLDQELIKQLPKDIAWNYKLIPYQKNSNAIKLLISESKLNHNTKNEIEILLDQKVELITESDEIVVQLLNRFFKRSTDQKFDAKLVKDHPEFIKDLISEALLLKSSDIHIETREKEALVRMRIDGKLIERFKLNKADYPAIINKIKIQANLDISEKRLPQDGRIKLNNEEINLDLRVSIIPTIYGEKAVLRLLNKDASSLILDDLGFSVNQLSTYRKLIHSQNGIILISGPTGSGKTTTLYATLSELNNGQNNILTIEDPIEYTMEGVNQVQLKEGIGLDFSRALKSFLRQDPDIIMVGEIRDQDTANMAIRAALTGHLVFSTIHTNSAWATVSRLIDMNIPPFLISATLKMSIAQRLIRKLCSNCKSKISIEQTEIDESLKKKIENDFIYEKVGCYECYYTGYKGRVALHEVIPINDKLKEEIRKNNMDEAHIVKTNKINTLSDQAIALMNKGITSLEEIYPILLNH